LTKRNKLKSKEIPNGLMKHSYLSSLKDREFLILRKLCDDSISQTEKEELEKELKDTRAKIKKLG